MNKRTATNVIVVLAVIVVVAGAAWFKSQRDQSEDAEVAPAATTASKTPTSELVKGSPTADEVTLAQPTASAPARALPAPPASQPTVKLPRVVDLGADKCKSCKALAPILEELKREYAGRVIVEFIDVWKNPAGGREYGIRVIPTQIFFDRDGNEVWRHEGFLPKAEFVAKFAELGVE